MSEKDSITTTYYHIKGRVVKEVGGEDVPCDALEAEAIIDYLLHALIVYQSEGFRFVDVDADATLSTADISINWSDYGIQGVLEDRMAQLAIMRMQAFDAHERNTS